MNLHRVSMRKIFPQLHIMQTPFVPITWSMMQILLMSASFIVGKLHISEKCHFVRLPGTIRKCSIACLCDEFDLAVCQKVLHLMCLLWSILYITVITVSPACQLALPLFCALYNDILGFGAIFIKLPQCYSRVSQTMPTSFFIHW